MRQKHDFSYLIKEYSTQYTLETTSEGYYKDNGDYVPGGTVPTSRTGVILPITGHDLQYAANGTYTRQDVRLYDVQAVEVGSIIEYRGIKYKVTEPVHWDEYSDFNSYLCKKVAK